MITTLLIQFFASFLYFILLPIPTVETMPDWYVHFTDIILPTLAGYLSIPLLGTMIEAIILALTIVASWQLFLGVNWLYNKIRGSG
jgi:hypothetical protein